jgi:hypothetical protein
MQKSGEPVCKPAGCEDERSRRLWESGGRPSGAEAREIELLPQRPIEPKESPPPEGSARGKR